jgi:hypothetical protein
MSREIAIHLFRSIVAYEKTESEYQWPKNDQIMMVFVARGEKSRRFM